MTTGEASCARPTTFMGESMNGSFGIKEHPENNWFVKMLSYPWMVLTSPSGLEKRHHKWNMHLFQSRTKSLEGILEI
jgi:hypothetical protein